MGGCVSWQAIHWVMDHSTAEGSDRLVLISIARHADQAGAGSWPSVATIAKECAVSERTVQRCLRSLAERRDITIELGAGGTAKTRGNRRPNRYLIVGMTPVSPQEEKLGASPGAPRGDTQRDLGTTSVSPKRSNDNSKKDGPTPVDDSLAKIAELKERL